MGANKKRKRNRTIKKRIRITALFALAIALIVVLMFLTPIFNIRNISVSGNNIVTLEQIKNRVGDIVGKNLFTTWNSSVEERLKEIAYIDEVEVSKNLIPPMIYVNIKECEIAAYFEQNGKQVIVNPDLKVLDDSNTFSLDSIPLIRGVDEIKYKVGKSLTFNDEEKEAALKIFLKTMNSTQRIGGVLYFDLSNITDLRFNYNGRIDVMCGSALELDKKLRMFDAALKSGELNEDSRGTIDLSNPDQGVYVP